MAIEKFRGEYGFLSNFYSAPTEYEGVIYPTSEHAFQAAKTLDAGERLLVLECETPGDSKRMGRKVTLRKDWNEVRLEVMKDCLVSKFTRNEHLKVKLLDTGDEELIEGNTWKDDFWGRCTTKGQNWLGKLLMEVRKELRNE